MSFSKAQDKTALFVNSPTNSDKANDSKMIIHNKAIDFNIKFLSGLIGSTLSSFVCSPLDLIKVRLQTGIESKIPKYSSFPNAVSTIYYEEGIKGLFKGAKMAVVTVPIFYSLYFPIYEHFKGFYANLIYKQENAFNSVVYTLSSASSALICDFITNPMWIVRVRKQTEFLHSGCQKMDSFNIIKEIINLYKKEGFWSLYRGLQATIFGIPHVIIQFNVYEYLKKHFSKLYQKEFSQLPIYLIFIISIVSKVSASFLTYPHEVVRNNLQNERNYLEKQMSLAKITKSIYRSQGISGFYGGFKVNLIRILPNNAIMFASYEKLSHYLDKKIYGKN